MDTKNLSYEALKAQVPPPLDFGGEVYYAFGWLPENKRLNDEIYRRAVDRATPPQS